MPLLCAFTVSERNDSFREAFEFGAQCEQFWISMYHVILNVITFQNCALLDYYKFISFRNVFFTLLASWVKVK